jgi:tryptophan halogenase
MYLRGEIDEPYAYACFAETPCIERKLGPRDRQGRKIAPYAWHLDANLLAQFLCRIAKERFGVTHVLDKVVQADKDERGYVTALRTETGLTIGGDLFLDCSGFRAQLIKEAMGEPVISMRDHLMVDRAAATPVAFDGLSEGIEPTTYGIAQGAGWVWKAQLPERFGAGYVYCSDFISDDEATDTFCRLFKLDPNKVPINHLRFQAQKSQRAWVKNVVAVGLAASWTEPMHATGIYQIYYSLYSLTKNFPDLSFDQIIIDQYNEKMDKSANELRDILQMHYYLSPRTDTSFWKVNKHLPISEDARMKLEMHRVGIPINQPSVNDVNAYYADFEDELLYFWPNHFYTSLFAGLDHLPARSNSMLQYVSPESYEKARLYFAEIKNKQAQLLETLPSTAEILTKIRNGGNATRRQAHAVENA